MLNQKALCNTSIGQIINLVTNDVRLLESHIPDSIGFPLAGIFQAAVSFAILLYMVGSSCLVGLFTMIFFMLLDGM